MDAGHAPRECARWVALARLIETLVGLASGMDDALAALAFGKQRVLSLRAIRWHVVVAVAGAKEDVEGQTRTEQAWQLQVDLVVKHVVEEEEFLRRQAGAVGLAAQRGQQVAPPKAGAVEGNCVGAPKGKPASVVVPVATPACAALVLLVVPLVVLLLALALPMRMSRAPSPATCVACRGLCLWRTNGTRREGRLKAAPQPRGGGLWESRHEDGRHRGPCLRAAVRARKHVAPPRVGCAARLVASALRVLGAFHAAVRRKAEGFLRHEELGAHVFRHVGRANQRRVAQARVAP